MKFVIDAPGQTCNRLWSYLDIVAYAIVNNSRVCILFWDPDIRYFDSLRNGPYSFFPFYNNKLIKILGEGRYLTCLFRIFDNKILHSFYRTKFAKRIGLICGWEHISDSVFHPQVRQKVLDIFRPNDDICKSVDTLFNSYRSESSVKIIGVHIRRGDYKTFENGKYYFSIEEYASMMRRMNCLLSVQNPEIKYRFFISTNEKFNPEIFKGLDYFVFTNGGTAIHDLYGLSKCDYILGPVSTFSMWAAWYGHTFLCHVDQEKKLTFGLDDFKIPTGFFQYH